MNHTKSMSQIAGVSFDCSVAYLQAFYDGTMVQIVPSDPERICRQKEQQAVRKDA